MTRPLARSWRNRSMSYYRFRAHLERRRAEASPTPPHVFSGFDRAGGRNGRNTFQELNQHDGETAGLALAVELEMTVRAFIVGLAERIAQLLRIGRTSPDN